MLIEGQEIVPEEVAALSRAVTSEPIASFVVVPLYISCQGWCLYQC